MTTGTALVILVSCVVLAAVIGTYAERKGYSALLFTGISLALTPLVGLVIALLMEDKRTPAIPPASPESSRAGELERLVGLRDRGALTEEEFAREKARVLGET